MATFFIIEPYLFIKDFGLPLLSFYWHPFLFEVTAISTCCHSQAQ